MNQKLGRKTQLSPVGLLLAVVMAALLLPLAAAPVMAESNVPGNPHIETVCRPGTEIPEKVLAKWTPVSGADRYVMYFDWESLDGSDSVEGYASRHVITGPDAANGEHDISDIVLGDSGKFTIRICAIIKDGKGSEHRSDEAASPAAAFCEFCVDAPYWEDGVSLTVAKGANTGKLVEDAYLSTLTKSGGRYMVRDEDGKKSELIAVLPEYADCYKDASAIKAAACWPSSGSGYNKAVTQNTVLYPVCASDLCRDGGPHAWKEYIKKATMTKDGFIGKKCSKCGSKEIITPLARVTDITLAKTSYTYSGKAKKPEVTVCIESDDSPAAEFTVTYSNNVNAGTGKAVVKMKSKWYKGSKTLTFKIKKIANTMKAKGKTVECKAKTLKKKAKNVSTKKAFSVSGANGKATYRKISGNKKIAVAKNGKVTIRKGLKKGTYKARVKVKAAGDTNHNKAVKTVTLTVKVR